MSKRSLICFNLGLFFVCASLAEILPANRRIPWLSGVVGGIPNRTTIFTNLHPGHTLAQINTAIARCPSNQVVFFTPGTYLFTEAIVVQKNGVTLRGAGPSSTILRWTSGPFDDGNIIFTGARFADPATSEPANIRDWTAGYTQGNTVLTVSSTTGLTVGTMLALDQLNDGITVRAVDCEYCGRGNGARNQIQLVRVVGTTPTTVTISPGLYMPNWSAAQLPQIWWYGPPVEMSGVEDVTISNATTSPTTQNVFYNNARNCWAKNVRSEMSDIAHFRTYLAANVEVRHCYAYKTKNSASQSYGVAWYYSSDGLAEDNIFNGVTSPIMCGPAAMGNVSGYNYCTNMLRSDAPFWMMAALNTHASHCGFNLFEGNYGNAFNGDQIHGSGSHNVIHRNRLTGLEPGKNAQTIPIYVEAMNHSDSVIGNILGTTGYHRKYQTSGSSTANGSGSIYVLGYADTVRPYPGGYDKAVAMTLLQALNWDAVTAGVISNGYSPNELQESYYRAGKPSWFGDRPWPPYDPMNPAASSPANIPAGYRFLFGVDPPPARGNQPPIVVVEAAPRVGASPLVVAFTGARSYDPEGAALAYHWTFGDGSISSAPNPMHAYSAEGLYVARLAVSDGTNTSSSADLRVTVGNQPPIALASASRTQGQPLLTVTFSSIGSTDPEGAALTYHWTFGDGETSDEENPTHIYASFGNYAARLTVSDGSLVATSSDVIISLNNGLVAAYGFEESEGLSTADFSGHDNTGLLVNNPVRTEFGRFGRALEFNGRNSYVTIPHSPSINLTNAVTLMAWCFPLLVTNSFRNVVYKPEDIYFLEGFTPVPNTPRFYGTFSSANLNAINTLAANQWTHLAGTYDGTTMRLYVNGVEVSSRAQTGPIRTSTHDLGIGGNSLNGQYFPGRIDEVRIYNRALSANEIQADMNTSVAGTSSRPTPPRNFRVLGE